MASVLRAETPRGWQKQRQRQHITQNATGPVLDVYERATFKIKRHNNSFLFYRAPTPVNCFLFSVHDRTRIRSKFRTVRRNVFPFPRRAKFRWFGKKREGVEICDRFWQRPRWRRKLEGDHRKKKRMPLPSRKVDRWRFFTHLARRASICIKLIGSPYWLLLFRAIGRENANEERERDKGRERQKRRKEGYARRSSLSYYTPFFDNAGKGIRNKRCAGSC